MLLIDIKMPEINGLHLYEKLREIDRNVKGCLLTASELFYEEHGRLDIHKRLEKEHFIQKPCIIEELIHSLNGMLYPQ